MNSSEDNGGGVYVCARECFERAQLLAPQDLRAPMNLANLARDSGDHATAQRLYEAMQLAQPNNPVIRRNALVSQEYNPGKLRPPCIHF